MSLSYPKQQLFPFNPETKSLDSSKQVAMTKKEERLFQLFENIQNKYSSDHYTYAIPGILSNKFRAYCSMREDLLKCLKYANLLKKKQDQTVDSALTIAMISLYGKCFTDASESRFPKLERTIFESTSFLALHDELMELRHHFIAHRAETESEIGIAVLLLAKSGDVEPIIKYSQLKRTTFSARKLDDIASLIEHLVSKVEAKSQKHGDKMHDALLKHFTPKELTQLLINNAKR